MKLAPGITLMPFLHGKILFAAHVRSLCMAERFDCIAVDIPEVFQDDIGTAVETLPYIQAVVARDFSESECCYVPADPCDAAIEGIRQSFQNHIPYVCIGRPHPEGLPRLLRSLPDEYAIIKIGFLTENMDTQLEEFKRNFDVILVGNESLEFVNNLLKDIL